MYEREEHLSHIHARPFALLSTKKSSIGSLAFSPDVMHCSFSSRACVCCASLCIVLIGVVLAGHTKYSNLGGFEFRLLLRGFCEWVLPWSAKKPVRNCFIYNKWFVIRILYLTLSLHSFKFLKHNSKQIFILCP